MYQILRLIGISFHELISFFNKRAGKLSLIILNLIKIKLIYSVGKELICIYLEILAKKK